MAKEPKRTYYIYCHTSPSGKRYIGQTCTNPKVRWGAGSGYVKCPYIHRAIEKYGWENFSHDILIVCHTKKMCDLLEKKLIAFFDTTNRDKGYNIANGGKGPTGVPWTEEHKKRHSMLVSGSGNGMYGRRHTAEARAAMSKKLTGRKLSQEDRELKASYLRKANEKRKKPVNQYDLDGNLIATYAGFGDVEKELGFNHAALIKACQGGSDTAYGFKWAYADEVLRAEAEVKRSKRPTNSMAVIQYDLDNNEVARYSSLVEAAKETGLWRDRIGDCCHGGLESYGGFLWKFASEKPRVTEKTAVIQLDHDGNKIQSFDSLAEASAKTGIPRYQIRNCCRGRQRTSHGFIWMFADSEWHERKPRPRVGVVQLDLDGNEVARYGSLAEAMRQTGQDRHRIVECCEGIKQSYRDSSWRYAEAI